MCIVSDCMSHEAKTVHAFTSTIIEYIKEMLPLKQRLFSDGALSQYKNFKNFTSLCYYKRLWYWIPVAFLQLVGNLHVMVLVVQPNN